MSKLNEYMINSKDLLQFFQDMEFLPPNDLDPRDYVEMDQQDDAADFTMTQDNIWRRTDVDHPSEQTYADYYMFTDPAAEIMASPPRSDLADKLNKTYKKKNLKDIQSVSDVHLEDLQQDAAEFPKHVSVKSTAEPSVFIHEAVLTKPTLINNKVYEAGTILRYKGYDNV